MTDDITATLAPKSDQLDAIELAGNPPVIVTITGVDVKDDPRADQPVSIHLAEFDRPWRPGKNMRRVLGYCWGTKSSVWVGRRAEIYFEEDVTFGKDRTGGIRVSRLSNIDGSKSVPILLGQGRSGKWPVEPIVETELRRLDLQAEWKTADPERRKAIEAEAARLSGGAQ